MTRNDPHLRKLAAVLLALPLLVVLCGARGERLELRHISLDLPGPPSKVIPTDLDGDGRNDLVIVVAYTELQEIGEDRIENMVQISTVIPALFDRREVRLYRADPGGGYTLVGAPMELPTSVLHLEPGPPGMGLVALTDEGLSRLTIESSGDAAMLRLDPVLADPPILAGTKSFYASLELVYDLDGDGVDDLLMPSWEGLAVYLGDGTGLVPEPAHRIELPGADRRSQHHTSRWYPFPEVREINGDRIPDLVFRNGLGGSSAPRLHVLLGTGGGNFAPLRREAVDCHDERSDLRLAAPEPGVDPWPRNLTALRDIDGDGRAEAVMSIERDRGDGLRKQIKDAKKPIQTYRFHELTDDLAVELEAYFELEVIGHTIEGSLEDESFPFRMKHFEDLDGDGREDLVSVTLDFSIFQVVKILATKKISIGLDFHVYHQGEDGVFREVRDLDLSEKLKLDLNNLNVARFAQFAGDFDGDGRHDFVHLGRGTEITLHRGQPGCRFPKRPDLIIELEEAPPSLHLVKIEDLDGDGRSDLMITRPLPSVAADVSAPVRLDLYLSGTGS